MPDKVAKAYAINDAKIMFVSLVGKAANKHQFLITKSEDGKADFQTYGRILKADAGSHFVTGIVYEPMVEDTDGNYMTEEEITKAAHWFAKNGNKVDLQHSFEPLDGAVVVESSVTKCDMELEGQAIRKGTWLMTVEIQDEGIFQAIEKGEITGFSMGGSGVSVATLRKILRRRLPAHISYVVNERVIIPLDSRGLEKFLLNNIYLRVQMPFFALILPGGLEAYNPEIRLVLKGAEIVSEESMAVPALSLRTESYVREKMQAVRTENRFGVDTLKNCNLMNKLFCRKIKIFAGEGMDHPNVLLRTGCPVREEMTCIRPAHFIGKQKQLPPMVSSVKVNGRKLYEYAREHKIVERPLRDIDYDRINLVIPKGEKDRIYIILR